VTAYARSKIEGEQLVVESDLDWRVVRLATVFGSGDRANFSKMDSALRPRRFVVSGDGGAKKSAIPVDLAAEIICEMALRDHVAHPLINVALPKAPTLTDIVNGFTKTCGFPAPLHIPILMLKTLALAGDLCSRIRPDFPLTTTNVKKLTTSTEIDVERLQAVFPGRVWPSFEECLQKHADWYRNLV
jgi:UDP-glucose 4-epimerase